MKFLYKIFIAVLLSGIFTSAGMVSESSASILGPVSNKTYLKECGSCHFAFQPQLLPKRSWDKIMGTLDNHFGDTATLDDAAMAEIQAYLSKNSADMSSSRKSKKILASLGTTETPLRITDTAYFKRKHREVRADVFKRKSIGSPANCVACHVSAEKGDFNERKVKIPK